MHDNQTNLFASDLQVPSKNDQDSFHDVYRLSHLSNQTFL